MWSLDPEIHHLNHGSFGAVPVAVQEARAEWLARWERATTAFIIETLPVEIDRARAEVAAFVGSSPEGFVFVRNASTAIASVVRSMEGSLTPGDQILTTSHDYNAVRQTLRFTALRTGAEVVVANVPFPIQGPAEVSEAVLAKVGPRTKLAVIDHVASPTGLVYPIDDLVGALEPAVPVLVDGAHGPGQVPLDLDRLGASWYAGNLHKWVCAPKGAGFLHTRPDRMEETVPVVVSHGWNDPRARNRYRALFDWLGTDDVTPWLAAPVAIRTVGASEPGGWPAVMDLNHGLALAARQVVCEHLDSDAPAPATMVGAMASLPLRDLEGDPISGLSPLTGRLLSEGFEALVMVWPEWPRQVLRLSAHRYNDLEEYRLLAGVLSRLEAETWPRPARGSPPRPG